MTTHLYLAPAAAGKTAYAIGLARDAAAGLAKTPRVVVPSSLQRRAWKQRLALAGGAIGVRLLTFDSLFLECLNESGKTYTELSDAVQHRLLRAVVDHLHAQQELDHYAPLAHRPGFIQMLRELIAELKAAKIWPTEFRDAVGPELRLQELARIYDDYQKRLLAHDWADRAGLGWLAVEALEKPGSNAARDWPLLIFDGFGDLTPVQLAMIGELTDRVQRLVITLTGETDTPEPRQVHRRFAKTRQQLEETLGIKAERLPAISCQHDPVLQHLEQHLFPRGTHSGAKVNGAQVVELVAPPDRSGEVREALRWLKARLILDQHQPGEVALLARSITPYRDLIAQTATEFGLPVRLMDGLPLRSNPAVAALLDLLRLTRQVSPDASEPALPRRNVVQAWRSPYFNWSEALDVHGLQPIGITPEVAEQLDIVARWGRVVGGKSQWDEILQDLARRQRDEPHNDDERRLPSELPLGQEAVDLRGVFERFVERITPAAGELSVRRHAFWLENLIGPDPAAGASRSPRSQRASEPDPSSLQMVAQARLAAEPLVERDVAALQALKDILRGLVWAEEALGTEPISYARFLDELEGAVEAKSYRLPVRPDRQEIIAAGVRDARGVSYRAVALLGLAEGDFPTTLREDPLLRDSDRQRLREEPHNLDIEPSTVSGEMEYFYETITRPRERVLVTRPRLADTGAPWQPSPYWEELRRLVDTEPRLLTSDKQPLPVDAASWAELLLSVAAHPTQDEAADWLQSTRNARWSALCAATWVFSLRRGDMMHSEYDGSLDGLRRTLARHYGPTHTWSSSRLEAYRSCPFRFFVASVLYLEPRPEPEEGLDVAQLGTIYHRILEKVCRAAGDPPDLKRQLELLPTVSASVLDEAPSREGFRETAWWAQTRIEIEDNVRRSLEALAELPFDVEKSWHELKFGIGEEPKLVVREAGDRLQVRGVIDRVDRNSSGGIRVIDYKTGGPYGYNNTALFKGEKIQLGVYALAAEQALGLGHVTEGFYWHVRHGEASPLRLSKLDQGAETATSTAIQYAWQAVRGVRAGIFRPQPPPDGCPDYCPAVGFCWHYREKAGGW